MGCEQMLTIIDYLTNPKRAIADFGKTIALIIGISVVYLGWRTEQRAIGEQKAVAKIEKATTNAANLGKGAAAKSAAGGVHANRRDPTTRD